MMINSRSPEQWLLLFVRDPSYVAKALTDISHRDHRYMLQQLIQNDILAHPRDADFEVFKVHMNMVANSPNHPDHAVISKYQQDVILNDKHPYHNSSYAITSESKMQDIAYSLRSQSTQQRGEGR